MNILKRTLITGLAAVMLVGSFTALPVKAVDPEEEIAEVKESELDDLGDELSDALDDSAKKFYFGFTSISIGKISDSMTKSAASFSNYFNKKKKSSKNDSVSITVSTSSGSSDKKRSDVLNYKHNPDMVKNVTEKEYDILCRIVEAEAGDQDVYGRILVANVVLNRVNYKKEFPNDIEGVVFEKNQFSPISNGAYYRVKVDDVTREAVDRCLEGEDYSEGALYFFMRSGTSKSAASWFDSLHFIVKYGCHEFFKY